MTDNGINQKVTELKTQVAALEQLLATDEQAVLEQADKLERALAALRGAELQVSDAPAEITPLSQAQPGMFIENSPVVLFRWRATEGWPVEFVSENVTQFGYTPKELLSGQTPYASIIHPDDLERVGQEVTAYSVNGPDSFRQEYRIITKNGEVRWTDDWTEIKRDATGRITHYQGLIFDITERKQSEDDLAKFKLGIERSTDAFFLTDVDGMITYVNSAFEEIYGFSQKEAVGENPRIIKSGLLPQEAYQHFWEELLNGGTVSGEIVNKAKDGRLVHVAGTNNPILDEAGNIIGFLAIHRDISAQREAEDSLREVTTLQQAILDNAEYGLISTTPDGTITMFNPAAERMLGYTADEVVGEETPAILHVPSEIRERARVFSEELGIELEPGFEVFVAKARQNLPNQHEWTYIRKDGSRFPVLLAVTALRDAEDNITGFLGIAQDVTEWKQAEDTLRRERALLHSLIDSVPDLIFYKDREGIYLGCNTAFAEFVGRSESELAGQTDFALFPTDVAEFFREQDQLMMAQKEARSNEEWVDYPDGRRVLLDTLKTPFYDAGGEVIGLIGISRDITERRQAEEERARLSTILEATSDFVGMVDAEGQSLYVNKAGREMIGIGIDEDISSLPIAAYHPERILPFMLEKALPTAVREGLWSGENVFLSRDGREIPILQVLIAQKSPESEVDYFATIARDITEQKQAEETLRQNEARLSDALDIANAAYWEFDVATQSFLFNDQLYALFHTDVEQEGGYRMPVEAFAGKFVYPEDVPYVAGGFQQAIETTDPNFQFERDFQIVCADGQMRTHLVRFRVEKDEQGQTATVIGANQDITETKEATEKIARQAAELQTVAEVSTKVATTLNESELLQEVTDLTKERFELYHAHIYLLDQAGEMLELAAGAGEVGRQMVAEGWSIPLDREQSLVAEAVRTGRGVIENDAQAAPGFMPNPLLPETRAEMAVPMMIGERVVGVLDVQAKVVDRFTPGDVQIQTTLATQIAVALESARLLEQTQQTSFQLQKRVKELDCLNDVGQEMELAPPIPELLQWVTERIPQAMQYPDLCLVAIEYDNEVYGDSEAVSLPVQMTHGLYIGGEILGKVFIAYTEKHDFLDEESALLGAIATRLSGYVENRRLFEQTRAALAEVEATQRRYTLQAWETYQARHKTMSYEEVREGVTPLHGILPPETSQALVRQKPVAVSSTSAHPPNGDDEATALLAEAKSSLIVPLKVRDAVIGALGLQETEVEREWTPEEIALVEAISEQVAQAAEQLRLFDDTQLRAARERRVNEIGEKIQAAQSLEEALRIAVQEVGVSLKSPKTMIQLEVE